MGRFGTGKPLPLRQEIKADGIDATRVVFKLVDQVGNLLPFAAEAIQIEVEGEGELIGPALISLIGGSLAAWVKSTEKAGTITITAKTNSQEAQPVVIRTK